MTTFACPDTITAAYFPAGCYDTGSPPVATTPPAGLFESHPVAWHMVPLSPTASLLVLVLLSILFTTLLISKPHE